MTRQKYEGLQGALWLNLAMGIYNLYLWNAGGWWFNLLIGGTNIWVWVIMRHIACRKFIKNYKRRKKLKNNYNIQKPIIKNYIGAVSAGIIDQKAMLDLNYEEDSKAQVDANFVICDTGEISEIQVTGEEYFFSNNEFSEIFELAKKGIKEIIEIQKKALD